MSILQQQVLLRQVLDLQDNSSATEHVRVNHKTHIAVPAMLSTWNRPGTLRVDLLSHCVRNILPDIRTMSLGWERDRGDGTRMRVDQLLLALVPSIEKFLRRRSPDKTGMRYPSEPHTRDMAGGSVYT